ncbi:AAA family ATPase [Serratia marcescens]|uniref:ATP-dependent nuclease n=1 Tax=unclassified Serratia (in: enterobacteria) TaxID=2647522 RepID=UPI0024AF72FD|nr:MULTISPECIES: AAA family ATPase [unclassified Serratia (in: enterobacteria)]EMB6252913.1 AAA family ATPase [Serratia marcescens]MDI6974270.1 AAA family ATPase [Serratia sp. Se-RSBMAAmG]MDI9262599.1 AAA family ATPase [Serratia sp. PF2-63]MDI9268443.1 AAA family ATPase [Serratia sp. PF-27]
MRLHSLKINGFKRIQSAKIKFGDATFLIGSNNAGKSSVLKAVEWLLSDKKRMDSDCFYSEIDDDTRENKIATESVILEAEFRNVPEDALQWRGFRGRIFDYDAEDSGETGKSLVYRKTYEPGCDVVIELKSLSRSLNQRFTAAVKASDLVEAGADVALVSEIFPDLDKKLNAADKEKMKLIDELWDISDDVQVWDKNPGGIAGVVLSRLPAFLLIPAESASHEIDTKTGALQKTLNELFKDVRSNSDNYRRAQESLNALARELNPADETSEFGVMMGELNGVLSGVFPESKIYATADLSDPDNVLVPSFSIEMSSNIRTCVSNQGTGMVRAAVFGLLRFRQQWLRKKGKDEGAMRSLIIGFEEPEIYLHPSAANQMRDLIYELSDGQSQIVATTHSPYLIDLSRKPRQVLNRFHYDDTHTTVYPLSVTDKFQALQDNDKDQVKMLIKLDDHVSRIFFTRKVIVVEGDTEEVIIKEAIRRMPQSMRCKLLASTELVKARGKAAIIGLVKYLRALDVEFFVIHDRDRGTAGAEVFNGPIAVAVGDTDKVIMLEECVENLLGYPDPGSEKPFKAYKETQRWGDNWNDVPEPLRQVLTKAFSPFIP